MSGSEFGIIVVGALVGWWAVSWLIDRLRRQPPPASPPSATAIPPPLPPQQQPSGAGLDVAPAGGAPSLAELGARWWQILGVERQAPAAAIEAAYRARIAALDAVQARADTTEADRTRSADERRAVEAAYEFIRAAGAWGAPPA